MNAASMIAVGKAIMVRAAMIAVIATPESKVTLTPVHPDL